MLQLHCVKFLLEQRKVEVNQQDLGRGWTPLMRVAHMAHHTEMPYLAIFEYLLQHGADASIVGQAITITGVVSRPAPCQCMPADAGLVNTAFARPNKSWKKESSYISATRLCIQSHRRVGARSQSCTASHVWPPRSMMLACTRCVAGVVRRMPVCQVQSGCTALLATLPDTGLELTLMQRFVAALAWQDGGGR